MAVRVLITGITGMAGSHLADYCLTLPDVQVFGIKRWRSRTENIEHLEGKLQILEGDIADATSMRRVMEEVRPDRIFHLAAQSFVPTSWNAPAETMSINVLGEVNLLEAVRGARLDPLIHIAGSSEEYGQVLPDEIPIKETNPLRPLSPYAVSKVAQEMLALQYWHSYGMRTIVTRAFNHEGPRRGDVFVTSSFAKQVAEVELGKRPPTILVGDLSPQRDWTDVRDVVRAYWLALEKGKPGEVYNIGSGRCRTVKEMLDTLLSFSSAKIRVQQDPSRLRPSDVMLLLGDSSKFQQATGWKPAIPLERTLEDSLNYWRNRLKSAAPLPVSS
jgi:GDP-4-dehydro-6-deoxy-D-mannose reductase